MITQNNDTVAESLARLTSVFKGKTKVEGLLTAFLNGYQDIEDTLGDFFNDFIIATAADDQLDLIGAIVGQSRGGRSDAEYRTYIYAKIGQNTSKGVPLDVSQVFILLTGSTNPYLVELYNATCELWADVDISSLDTAALYEFMQIVLSAGVQLGAIGYFDPDDYFGFFENPDASGYGDLADSAIGGTYSSLV